MSMLDLFKDMQNDPTIAQQTLAEVSEKYDLTEKEKEAFLQLHENCQGLKGKKLEERINAMRGGFLF